MKRVKFLHVSKITLLRRTLKRAPQVITCHPMLDLLGKVLSKHLDILYIYYTRLNYQLKFMALVMVYVKICGGRQINRHAKSCSCWSYSGSYCDSNIKNGNWNLSSSLNFYGSDLVQLEPIKNSRSLSSHENASLHTNSAANNKH